MCWLAIQNLSRKTLNQTVHARHSLGVPGKATEESPRLHGRVVGKKGEQSVNRKRFHSYQPKCVYKVYPWHRAPASTLALWSGGPQRSRDGPKAIPNNCEEQGR